MHTILVDPATLSPFELAELSVRTGKFRDDPDLIDYGFDLLDELAEGAPTDSTVSKILKNL